MIRSAEIFREPALRITFGIMVLLFLLAGESVALSNSGGGSWQIFEGIMISNSGGTLSDYQVLVNLTGSNFPINAKTNGADIRFMDANGSELSYWIEKWDYANRSAKVWVNVTSIPTGASTISMLFGNPSAVSSSNGDLTFVFFDDFEKYSSINDPKFLAIWERFNNQGGSSIENGRLHMWSTAVCCNGQTWITKADFPKNIRAKFEVKYNKVQDYYNPRGVAAFLRSLHNYQTYASGLPDFFIGCCSGGQTALWGDSEISMGGYTYNDAFHSMELTAFGNTMSLYRDDLFLGSVNITKYDREGAFGFYVHGDAVGADDSYFDNVRLSKYVLPEPSVSLGIEIPITALYSSSTFGASGSNPFVPFSYEPVNLGSGNYIYQYNDLFIPGRGLPLAITRSYNSLDFYNGSFGHGWTFNYNINLAVTKNGDVVVMREDGRRDFYTLNSDGSYSSPLGTYDKLAENPDGTYTLNKKDQEKYSFTSQGKLNRITDKNGNQINLTYLGNYLTNVTDVSGRELDFAYDTAGRIVAITDPIGRVWSYAYDDKDNLVQYTNPLGGQFRYSYNEKHWMTSITDPRGNHIMTNTYDADGHVISQSNALGAVTSFSYDAANLTSTVTDPLGRKKSYNYNDHFWELNETDALGNTTSYAYDGNGNRIGVTDANDHTIRFAYDANGNIIQIIDPLGNSTTLIYDSMNNLISGTDALGQKTSFKYDTNGNPVKITNAIGYVTTLTYDQYGQLIGSKDANGNAISFVYDDYGNPTSFIDALGNTVTFYYDSVGRLLSTTDAKGYTSTLSYDVLNRLIGIADPLGHTANYSYDGIGNKISFTDANGYTTFYSYTPLNQLVKVTDPMGGTVTYNYDAVENLLAMTDANGHTTNYNYDPLNRLASITDPLGHTTSYAYDPAGNRVSAKDNNGNTTRFTYDALNRLTGISYQDGTSASYVYDAVGNRMAMTDSSGTTSYAYDGLNRLTSVTNLNAKVVKYGYDPVGNRIQMTYPDGRTVSYSYDGADRLVGITDWNGSATNYAYDVNDNLEGISYPNGIKAEYSYDKADRLIKLVDKNQTQVISSFVYTLDAVGNRLKSEEMFSERFDSQTLTTAYDYDKLYRLTKVAYPFDGNVSYNYDAMGNRIRMTTTSDGSNFIIDYTYDAADQLQSAGDTIYTYDNNGNLIKTNRNPGIIISYSYDNSNRLINISTASDSKRDLYNFKYDGDGNRISKTVIHGKSLKQSNYVWDVNSIIPQVLTESDGKDTIVYTNGIGIISMTDPSRGAVLLPI